MKHYLRFMLVLLLSTVWCVGGYSQETKTYNYEFKSGDFSTSKSSATLGGVNWTLKVNSWNGSKGYGFDTDKTTARGFKIGSNKTNYPKNATLSTDGINGTITSIVVNTSGNSGTTAKLDVMVGEKAFGVQKNLTSTATDFTFEGSATGKIELKYTNSNKPIYIKSITVTYKEAPSKAFKSLAISGSPTKKTYNDGDEFDPTGLEVTGTYDDNTTATITDGISWTKTPAKLAVGNTSCSVTATVNGVTSPAYEVTGLTVVKSIKPIVFDFTADPNVWGVTPLQIHGKDGSNVIAGKKLVVERVVMTATNGNDYGTCIFKNSKGSVNLRVYIGGSITFTAPEGYNLSNITFDFDNTGTFSTDVQTWKTPTWTGNAHTVTFTCKTSIQVNTATIKLVAATPVTPEVTSGTIEFKAVDNDLYYATFSSDKDVVFYKDLDVFGVSVAGGNISQNSLTKGIYNVTDATAGEDKDGAVEGYYVPANTGVLVVCLEKTVPYYFPKEEAQTVTLPALPANQLQPAPANGGKFTHDDGYKYYKLAYDNYSARTGLGFYWGAENGGAFNVKAGTAYLAVPTSESNAKGFAFDGETTGIENVNVAANQSKTIYNLNGQRVSNMSQAGLYIVNGKKVVIRK